MMEKWTGRKFSVLTIVACAAGLLGLPDGLPSAEEGSSPNYVLERAVLSAGGGESSSPSYSLLATAGQGVECGDAESPAFSTDTGFLNDIDLDSDGIAGLADMCPTQFAGCADVNADGCIDLPDPDDDGDGVTVGECDCDDGSGEMWRTPGEVVNLFLFPLSGESAVLTWEPPLAPGGSPVYYEVLRSLDASDFVSLNTECAAAGPDTSIVDAAAPGQGEVFFYLLRGTNGCPVGQGTLGVASNSVLRIGRDCS
jgi:hypothetical protein